MVKAGKLKILAVHNDTRSQFFPDVPTSEELGIKGLTVKWWLGLSLPAGTPDYIVKKWDESAAKMVKDAAFNEKLKSLNCEVSYMNSADVSKLAKLLDVAEKKGLRK